MKQEKAIVCLSGGMDSCVTAAVAFSEGYDLYFLYFDYRQRTQEREFQSFSQVTSYFLARTYDPGISKEVAKNVVATHALLVDAPHLKEIGGSSLTDKEVVVSEANLESEEIPTSYVPFRNTNILSVAVSWAEAIGATKIFIGAVEEDSSGYPDTREEYYKAFNQLVKVGTRPETHIEVVTPLIHMRKSEIVKKGLELKAPLGFTWSCYSNNDKACGKCDSCALRIRAFKEAGVKDLIPYAIDIDWGKGE